MPPAVHDPDLTYGFSRYLEVMLRERFPSMYCDALHKS